MAALLRNNSIRMEVSNTTPLFANVLSGTGHLQFLFQVSLTIAFLIPLGAHPGRSSSRGDFRMIFISPSRLFSLQKSLQLPAFDFRCCNFNQKGAATARADQFVDLVRQLRGQNNMCSHSGHCKAHSQWA